MTQFSTHESDYSCDYELYATPAGYQAVLDELKTFVHVTAVFPPMPDDVIHLYEIDADSSLVGSMKTGRVATLRIVCVESQSVLPWYTCGVDIVTYAESFHALN